MLNIKIPAIELFDEEKQEFITVKETELCLEHSLVSISKWESKWHKPFLGKENKTREEIIDYIKCMTITQNVDQMAYEYIPDNVYSQINEYINDPMTASSVPDDKKGKRNPEQITSELVYYWMVAFQIPFECQKWHLNRLLMLIKICNHKNATPKKMSKNDILARNKALNDARRKQLHSRG